MYVTKEEIAHAKEMDLLTYLRTYEPQELVHVGGSTYSTKTHDSLKIEENGVWCWWSRSTGGRSALDYLILDRNLSLPEVVTMLNQWLPPPVAAKTPAASREPQAFVLPPRSKDSSRVRTYLAGRGISSDIVDHCMVTSQIYEDAKHHNCVFVGFDAQGKAQYATKRGTGQDRFFGDVGSSDKRYSFCLAASEENTTLHLFECAIDVLSYATLCEHKGKPWQSLNLLSLSGVYRPRKDGTYTVPCALAQYLQEHPNTQTIALHLDNDKAGRDASAAIAQLLWSAYEILDHPPPSGKDVNDHLCSILKPPREAKHQR